MQNGQILDDKRSSPSASVAGGHNLPIDPESDYHSDDDHDTASRNGNGKRKRPISVSYVHVTLSWVASAPALPLFILAAPDSLSLPPYLILPSSLTIHITYIILHVRPHTIPYHPVLRCSRMQLSDLESTSVSSRLSLGSSPLPCLRVLPLHPMRLSLMTCVHVVQDLSPSGHPLCPPQHFELVLTPLPLGASSANSAR
jgi:hypothetical protein